MSRDAHDVCLSIPDLTPQAGWGVELTAEDHAWLESITKLEPEQYLLSDQARDRQPRNRPEVEPILLRDLYGWRAGRYIGEIHHQGRTLRITPRLGIGTIAEWLSTIHNVQIIPEAADRSHGNQSLVIQLAAAMWRAVVAQAGTHSLARQYTHRSTTGLEIHGKIDAAATSRLRVTGYPGVVSTMKQQTLVTSTNAAIVAADRVLSAHMGNPQWRGERIGEQLTILRKAVGTNPRLPSRAQLSRVRYTPITLKWKAAAELSHRIASNRLLKHTSMSSATYGLLIDVAELWERFVLHCAAKAVSETVVHGTADNLMQHLLQSESVPTRGMGRLYPDILIGPSSDHTTARAVIDAKYKPLVDPRGVDREDLYQLHAYSLSFASEKALLAYPMIQAPVSSAETNGPWKSPSGAQLEFLRLPTNEEQCIALLQRCLVAEHAL